MDLGKLYELLKDEKPYRVKQVENAVFFGLIEDWYKVTSLPLVIRELLQKNLPLDFDFRSIKSTQTNTYKALIGLNDSLFVETVLLMHKENRNTVCVSLQVGCPLDCIFCRTAKVGFERNLTKFEIVMQVLFFQYFLKGQQARVTNVVFMGMGEPFLNYDNVMGAIRIFNDKNKFNIGARKISISTCGIPEKIEQLADEKIQVNLAVSLNAPDDVLRTRLMPVNKKYSLEKVMSAVKKYINRTNRRVMFEYVLIENINDSTELAKELANLLKGILCFVNLIPYNGKGTLKPPSGRKIKIFRNFLKDNGIAVTQRYRFGQDISAACGQLVYSE